MDATLVMILSTPADDVPPDVKRSEMVCVVYRTADGQLCAWRNGSSSPITGYSITAGRHGPRSTP